MPVDLQCKSIIVSPQRNIMRSLERRGYLMLLVYLFLVSRNTIIKLDMETAAEIITMADSNNWTCKNSDAENLEMK